MAPVVVHPIGAADDALEVDVPDPAATVADLKVAIEAKAGINVALQRLVVRGRVLDNSESLTTVLPHGGGGGRIFLATSAPKRAKADSTPAEADLACIQGGSSGSRCTATSGSAFEVIVRTIDSEAEIRVCARPGAPCIELKREILCRLQHIAELKDAELCCFIHDGRMLESEVRLQDAGVSEGACIVVVPPRPSPAPRCRCSWRGFSQCAKRVYYGGFGALCGFPKALWFWLRSTWHDPWSLVRPVDRLQDGARRGPRIHSFNLHPRLLRYGPGQNPHGEDLTLLFSQGMLGGAG